MATLAAGLRDGWQAGVASKASYHPKIQETIEIQRLQHAATLLKMISERVDYIVVAGLVGWIYRVFRAPEVLQDGQAALRGMSVGILLIVVDKLSQHSHLITCASSRWFVILFLFSHNGFLQIGVALHKSLMSASSLAQARMVCSRAHCCTLPAKLGPYLFYCLLWQATATSLLQFRGGFACPHQVEVA